MLQDINHLPRIINPDIRNIHTRKVGHTGRDLGGLFLELVVDDEDAELGGLCETGAFRWVLNEGELGGDVLDEFFQGVSGAGDTNCRVSAARWLKNGCTYDNVFRESSISSTTRIRFPRRPPWLILLPS
jgi:hypothetical protein